MSFSANYFDGKSSKTHKATITTDSLRWKIFYQDESLSTKEVSWRVDDIEKSEVYTKGLVAFKYGKQFPFEKIESSDKHFIEYVNNVDKKNITNKLDNWLHNSTTKSIAILLLTIIGFTVGMYFYVIPAVAVNFAKNLPKQQVVNFGDYVFRVISQDLEIDDTKTEKLQSFVNSMKLDSEFPITVYVAKNKQLNAFAISGGKFVIYTGLLEKLETEHQLASLIGHEISHIKNRHALKSVARNLSGAIFVSVLLGDVSGVTAIIGENAHNFMQLSHSRSLEKEADTFGLKIVDDNNLDQNGMPELFEILKRETNFNLPSFLSSHPILEDRINYTKKVAKNQKKHKENLVLKEKWKLIKSSTNSNNNDNE